MVIKMPSTITSKWGMIYINKDGYYRVSSSRVEEYVGKLVHRLVFEDFYKIKLPSNIIIHHNDGNKLNNEIWNLIPMTFEEHSKLHNSGDKSSLFGKKMSEETKRKISLARMGKKHSKETKQKISSKNRGRIITETWRNNISNGMKGRKLGIDSLVKHSKTNNNSLGIFRVHKIKCSTCKKGFRFVYMAGRYPSCIAQISSVDLLKLKKKILKKGFEWIIVDEEKAENTAKSLGLTLEDIQ